MVKIFSIRDKYSDKIFSKEKLVELRRQNIRINKNEKCLIYTTSPVKRITGYFIVKEKIRLPIKQLWNLTKDLAGVTKQEFMRYFHNCKKGTAIFIKSVKRFVRGIHLNEVKKIIKDFNPPQSYYNIDERFYYLILNRFDERTISLYDF